jgi:hypothetical protein
MRRITDGLMLAMVATVLPCVSVCFAADRAGETPGRDGKAFELQLVVDFFDDLIVTAFSDKTLNEMMRTFESWGVTRVYWNGQSYLQGLYDASDTQEDMAAHAFRTYKQIGDFIPAAIKAAHAHGMEIYVEFKPFDMYFPLLAPHDMTLFRMRDTSRKGIPAIGGRWQMGCVWPEQHTHCLMARNMTGIRAGLEREAVGAIKFVKNDDKPTGINKDNLELYVSEDNHHYQKCDGPYAFTDEVEYRPVMLKGLNLNKPSEARERVRVISLSGLDIREPYIAVSTRKKTTEPDFANLYYKLVEMYTAKGEPMPFTYGIPAPFTDQWIPPEMSSKPFPDRAFPFDLAEELICNNMPFRANDKLGYLDSQARLVGLAKGKNRYITALCPAYPEVRKYWLDQIKEFIEWDVDGVEFRWPAHQDTREWDAYGFNDPVVKEYKKRYGVDILTQDFDRGKWRALLGEYYTQFYRDAKALLAKHGRKMMVDVMPNNDSDPSHAQFANVFLDWQTWFSFADGVSFKWVQPGSATDAMFRKVADRYGIPTYYNVFQQVVYKDWDKDRIVAHLKLLKETGHKGTMLYESAGFMKAKPDGAFDILYPQIPEVITPAVKAMNADIEKNKVNRRP